MWVIIDVNGKFKSKMKWKTLDNAFKYLRILRNRYPEYDLKVVMES